ncbi:MAG: hypothetical protein QXO84_01935 [Candidatus Aenigmatarchaeota archaeon]
MIDLVVLKEHDNKLLERKELLLELNHAGQPTPKKTDVERILSERFGVSTDHVEIIYILSYSGKPASKVKARLWSKPVKKEEVKSEAQAGKEVGND